MFKIREGLCAFNKDDWNRDKENFSCPSVTNVYHCIMNDRKQSGEICTQRVWVETGHCPEFNTYANAINTVLCNQTDGCPENAFQSDEVYKYPVCINEPYQEQPTAVGADDSSPWPFVIGISVAVVVIVSVIAIICCIRRQKPKRDQEKEEKVPLLLRKNTPFYKTSAFHEAVTFLQNGGKFLCLHGRWGSGKTTTAKQVYLSVTGRKPVVIENIAEFDDSSCADCIIIEEPFSKQLSNVEVENIMSKIKIQCSKIGETLGNFAIFVFSADEWVQISDGIKGILMELDIGPLCDISLNYDNLSSGDRNQILHTIFSHYNPTEAFRKVENIVTGNETYLGYAETCTLLSRCRIFQTKPGPVLFFNRPLLNLKVYLERMCTSSEELERSKFVMLVFMSLNEKKIDLTKSNAGLRKLFVACDLSPEKIQLTSIIPDEFVLREEEEVYVLQHDVIQRMVLVVFGTHHFEKLVRFSSWNSVPDWIREKAMLRKRLINEATEYLQPILEISHEQLTELRKKI